MKKPATVYDVTDEGGYRRMTTGDGIRVDGAGATRWARVFGFTRWHLFIGKDDPQAIHINATEADAVLWVAEGVLP